MQQFLQNIDQQRKKIIYTNSLVCSAVYWVNGAAL